jgi:2-C-methyl-D-erythritol 2,4-cyclodiphosphate synthase
MEFNIFRGKSRAEKRIVAAAGLGLESKFMATIRTGIGVDTHRFAKGRRLILGGVEVDHKLGLDGHSDADVLCHAVMDALLGAVADGDIGMHFPNTSPEWKDARSLDLLKEVVNRLRRRGARVVNVDATIIAERPKIAPHAEAMRRNMARVLGVQVDQVSVKATTAEKMGALGRAEGIAAMAVATVEQRKDSEA